MEFFKSDPRLGDNGGLGLCVALSCGMSTGKKEAL